MRTWLPLSMIVLLLAGLAVFLLSDDSKAPSKETTAEAIRAENIDPAEELAGAPKVDARKSLNAVDPIRTNLSQGEASVEMVYGSPAEEGILISVVDADTQEPLPRAEVMVIDTGVADLGALQAEMTMSADFEKVFEHLGVIYKTDHKGQVRIPFAVDSHIIAGRTPTHFNFSLDVDEGSEELTLELNPIVILRVKVVDTDGNPAVGAPVSLRIRTEKNSQDFTTAYSDADGIAKIKLFQLLMLELADDEVYVALLFLSDTPVETRVNLKELPDEPPVLVAPNAGKLEVHILDTHGKPASDTFLVHVNLLLPEDSYDGSENFSAWNNPREHLTGRSQNGIAHFPLVDYNQRLHVSVVSTDGELRAESFGEGPVRNGGPAIFTLVAQAEDPVLVGRILNTEGAIGPNLNLEYRIGYTSDGGSNSSRSGPIHTDASGYFRFVVEDLYKENTVRSLTINLRATREKPESAVAIDLSYFLAPGENELGDLVLVVPPLIASGAVVDANGAPLSNAQVRLENRETDQSFGWTDLGDHRAKTDRVGKFEIRADLGPASYRLTATLDSYLDSSLPIVQGAENVRLVMNKSITLKGKFLLDKDIDVERVEAVLQTASLENEDIKLTFFANLREDGSFQRKNLPPGPATLILRSKVYNEELYFHSGLTLISTSEPQILEDIDLRGVLHTLRVWVRNTRGEMLSKVQIWTHKNQSRRSFSDNPYVSITRDAGIDLKVAAQGYQVVDLQQVIGDQEVVLQDGFPIQVDILNLHLLPEDWQLLVFLEPLGEDGRANLDARLSNQVAAFGPTSEPTRLMMHGDYQVRFLISQEGPNRSGNRHWLGMKGVTMQVADLAPLQSFRYSLDEKAVADAIAYE
ncbi:MAG: carboxypeptidase regulatory-like domain-containing protein [Planctomycetota bacterium]|nr:carboxypeptidase regulatory-like domain-containing protein [Planctomycetota bacterium]